MMLPIALASRRVFGALPFVALAAGCSPDPGAPAAAADRPESFVMPSLELRYTSASIESSPASTAGPVRVSSNGSVLMSSAGPTGTQMLVVDSLGHELYRFGPVGEGPGELRLALPLGVTSSSALVTNLTRMQLATYDTLGTLAGTLQLRDARAIPLAALGDSAALSVVPGPDGALPAVLDLSSGELKMLLNGPDSITASFAQSAESRGIQPAMGTWASGFVIGDPVGYRLALYDWQGQLLRVIAREIPAPRTSQATAAMEFEAWTGSLRGRQASPAEREAKRQELLEATVPHFSHRTALEADGNGRLWVLGPEGDSAYADVFSPTGLLGRLPLPCRGIDRGIAINDSWLAVACKSEDPEYLGDAVLKLFRIQSP